MNMVFTQKCASSNLHEEWNIQEGPLDKRHVAKNVRDKLLELANKNMRRDFYRSNPVFCRECLNKVKSLFPELFMDEATAGPHTPPCSHDTVDTVVTCGDEVGNDEQSKDIIDPQPTVLFDTCPYSYPELTEFGTTAVVTNVQYTQTETNAKDAESQTEISANDAESQTSCTSIVIDLADPSTLLLLTTDQLNLLSFHIGKTISSQVRTDGIVLSNEKTMESLLCLEPSNYLAERNETLVGFFSGICNSSLDEMTENKRFLLCKTVESVMNLSAGHLLLPFHFRESILLYSMTGSKVALSMLGSSGPHGGYKGIKLFLNNLTIKDAPNEDGDVVLVFDNNQVLHRQWNVNIEGKFQCHLVTMVAVFNINPAGSLQKNVTLKPGTWMLKNNEKVADVRLIDQTSLVKKHIMSICMHT